MIEIKCAAVETAKTLCKEHGVTAATHVLEMIEREIRLGWCAAQTNGEKASVLFLQATEALLTDALLRALLNTLRANGVRTAHITDETLARFMVSKGYFSEAEEKMVQIADFFAKSTCKV